jgi:triacylglycerol lipase
MHESGQPPQRRLGSRFAGSSGVHRRILSAATVLVIAVVGAAAGACSGSSPTARLAHNAPVRAAAGSGRNPRTGHATQRGVTAPAQNRLGPVLLVPGYGGESGSLAALASQIRAAGRRVLVLGLPGTGTGSLVADAAVLKAAATRVVRRGAPSVDVIGYSAGGVVALWWARHDGGATMARRIVTLGAPFHGTELAAAAQALVPGQCPVACRQPVPGSSLLASLDVAHGAGLPPWLSLWTAYDQVVTPPDSARLTGAIDVPVQSVCPGLTVTHTELPSDPAVIRMVLVALGRSPLARPSAGACR